jgi:molecular chaperone GrpE
MSRHRHKGNGDGHEAAGEPVGADATAAAPADAPAGLEPAARPAGDEAASLRRELAEVQDALLRRRAEFENYKRRVERDQASAATDAAAEILRRLVDTVDNLERALAATGGEDGLRKGVELTLRDFRTALESQGVVVLDPVGERFDPAQHQALLHEDVPGFAAGAVAGVLRKGYTYKDRLLRPALVKVASGGSAAGEDGGQAGGGGDVQ